MRRSVAGEITLLYERHRVLDQILAQYYRGAFLLRTQRPGEAADYLAQVVRAAPGRSMTTQMAANALFAAGKPEEALALTRFSLENAPDERNQRRLTRLLEEVQEAVSPN